jgi:hypothetical protein
MAVQAGGRFLYVWKATYAAAAAAASVGMKYIIILRYLDRVQCPPKN